MSKAKKSDKRVVKTIKTTGDDSAKSSQNKAKRTARDTSSASSIPLIFNRHNYIYMGIGVALIALGLVLMSGGGTDDPSVFDADRIYSFRRITLAPFIIIVGLLVEVYAIFKK
jgi:hypothetical protein